MRLVLFALTCIASAALGAGDALPPPLDAPRWRPTQDLRWQMQYSTTPVDLRVQADVYKIDLFDTTAAEVARLKKAGKRAVCYLNAGAWEDWRPDAKRFPKSVIGSNYEGWPGERWLDIRRIDALAPIMLARLDQCRSKGFDGVLLDNVDGYTNKTGFPLMADDQLRFNTWFANEAHKRGLAVGMNNNPEQARDLAPYFDWSLAESCFTYKWCSLLGDFTAQGKPVLVVEYLDDRRRFQLLCEQAQELGVTLIRKRRELDAFRDECKRQ